MGETDFREAARAFRDPARKTDAMAPAQVFHGVLPLRQQQLHRS